MTEFERASQAADYIRRRVASLPTAAVVLGSGLGFLAQEATEAVTLPYGDIPHFPAATNPAHAGCLVAGRLAGRPVFLFSGRVHGYEGYTMRTLTFYVRVLHVLGVRSLLLTNAAGGINEAFTPGDLMLITDHLKLTAQSPLTGDCDGNFGVRFPDMSRVYSPRLQAAIRQLAAAQGLPLRQGVYAYMGGPQYETPAEIRALRVLGADAVGMSTVPEAIVAAACGMEVAGLSCITNMAAGVLPEATLTDEEVVATAANSSKKFSALVRKIVEIL